MNQIVWKGKPFKSLSFGKNFEKAGRNFSGRITIFHRGGGRKKLYRRIDYERKNVAKGIVERVEYDPNRTARIALIRWSDFKFEFNPKSLVGGSTPTVPVSPSFKEKSLFSKKVFIDKLYTISNRNPNSYELLNSMNQPKSIQRACSFNKKFIFKTHKIHNTLLPFTELPPRFRHIYGAYSAFSYILAWEDIKPRDEIYNFEDLTSKDMLMNKNRFSQYNSSFHRNPLGLNSTPTLPSGSTPTPAGPHENHFSEELSSKTISVRQNYKKRVFLCLYI